MKRIGLIVLFDLIGAIAMSTIGEALKIPQSITLIICFLLGFYMPDIVKEKK